MGRRWMVVVVVLAVVAAGTVGIYMLTPQPPPRELPVLMRLPDFGFTERSGRSVSLSDLAGSVWVANFVFTHCTGPCPLLSAQMQGLQAELAGLEGVRLVSFSVDPERDTPEVLAAYAKRFGADPRRWLFLTGGRHEMYGLIREGFKLGVQAGGGHGAHGAASDPGSGPDPMAGSGDILHTLRFALVDREGRVRGYYDGTDPGLAEVLVPDVRRLVSEGS